MVEKEQAKGKGNEEASKAVLEERPEVDAVESSSPSGNVRPSQGIDRSKISKKALKMAKEFGVPIESILEWAESVDARFQALQAALPEAVGVAVERTLMNLQKKAVQDQKQAMHDAIDRGEMPRGGGRGSGEGGALEGIITKALLSGEGGGMNEQMQKLQMEMIRASIDNMKQGASNSKAITDAVVGRITQKAIGKTLDDVTK